MNLLAFDTSTDTLSIAVARDGTVWQHTGPGGAQASATLIPAVAQLLERAGLDFASLDAIAFGRGPGSFTGLRTACAVAQGLALGSESRGNGRGVPALPIDTLWALAEQARLQYGCTQVVAVLDARMDEVYAARYQWQAGAWHRHTSDGSDGSDGSEFSLCKPEALLVPPGWTVAGNAQAAYGERLAPDATHVHALPTAAALLSLSPALLAAGSAVTAEHALPLYVRDKVAKTTAERMAERDTKAAAAVAASAAPAVPTAALSPTSQPQP